jgi:hypothetical protein
MISDPIAKIAKEEKEHLEWLGLPTCPFSRHPLRLSLGHRAHGLPMTTGWPESYTSASDFDHRKCHIAVETWASNISKLDWGPPSRSNTRRLSLDHSTRLSGVLDCKGVQRAGATCPRYIEDARTSLGEIDEA